MFKLFPLLVGVLFSCASSGGIHNDGMKYRHKEMIKQDVKMKRQMQAERKKATPRNKRNKIKKAKRKNYFI